MGPARGGPLPGWPLGIPVAITDQSDHKGTIFKPIAGANEDCVNQRLQINQACGAGA